MAYTIIVNRKMQAGEYETEQQGYDAALALNPMCCFAIMNDDDFTAVKYEWGYADDDQDFERPMLVMVGRFEA